MKHFFLQALIRNGTVELCIWGNAGDVVLSTDESWEVAKEKDLKFFFENEYPYYNVASISEEIKEGYRKNTKYENAIVAKNVYSLDEEKGTCSEIEIPLKKRNIPMMYFDKKDFIEEKGGIYDAGTLTCGYVRLKCSGKGKIKLTYAEGKVFIDADGSIKKRKRDDENGIIIGQYDVLAVDGECEFEPFWMRTFRYIKAEIEGDIRAFIKTVSYNFNVEKFMKKWLADMRAEQHENGLLPNIIPDVILADTASAAWGDAAVICPWQIYLTYGNKEILKDSFESMKLWINYITTTTKDKYLWTGGVHYGDWLGIDAPYGSYKGSSRDDFVASAFYAYSTSIVVEAGKVIGEDVTYFEELYKNILKTFRETFTECKTQTEHALAICFDLFEDKKAVGASLAKMVLENGNKLTTGFVGTAYLLQALSVCGYTEIAYNLLLQTEYPSWLFSVKMGATTIWEHWDGIKEDGTIWPADMNSFNHYSFGSVADWVYEFAAGIKTVKEHPGFEKIVIEPHPDKRLGHLEAKIDTKYGTVRSYWVYQQDNSIRYEISVPTEVMIIIDGDKKMCSKGTYIFYSSKENGEMENDI